MSLINHFVNLYPLWIVLASAIGILHPPAFLWFSGRWVEGAIALVMLGMGFTLTIDDFKRLFKIPGSFALGFACQYTIMPLIGWFIGRALNLEPGFAAGLILVAACPGGVASNLIAWLARANVALSVVLTMTSTLTAFVMTPLWCKALAGTYVEVDALGICLSTLRAVVAPVLIGVFCNWRFPRAVAKAAVYGPLVSVIAIIFIAGSIIAPNAEKVVANAGKLTLALTLLHGLGFMLGFWVTRIFRFRDEIARTVAIEVGMQNGGMAAMLAKKHFAADPLVGVPAVFCSVVQTLLGSLVAAWWRFRPLAESDLSDTSDSSDNPVSQDRTGIYYWKCDRAAAFHGTEAVRPNDPLLEPQLLRALEKRFPGQALALTPADGQGNHRTFRLTFETPASADGVEAVPPPGPGGRGSTPAAPSAFGAHGAFVRIEDGPERDNYFAVETVVTAELQKRGIPAPRVLACDCSRTDTPFAWQVLEYVPYPDLNQHFKQGVLAFGPIAEAIGEAVARWQEVPVSGYGPFSAEAARATGRLVGLQPSYSHYLFLNLDKHLSFLTERGFFTPLQAVSVLEAISSHRDLLGISPGCLVHKDLALWNILGAPDRIAAYIDWDDAISGDPMDDLSLLGCFYGAPVIGRALAGYARVRPLPADHLPRFWLCLLRNLIVKAVIRVGAGYFKRDAGFYLIGAGSTGAELESFTRTRIDTALRGLNENCDLSILSSSIESKKSNHSIPSILSIPPKEKPP